MKLNRNASRDLAARFAAGEELTVLERAVLLDALASDLETSLRGTPAMNGPWSRAQTIATLAAQFVTSLHHRAAISREAERSFPQRRPVLRLVQGEAPPSKIAKFVTDWLGKGRGGAA